METLRQEFTQNADRLGTHTFKQVKRDGKAMIYSRHKQDGSLFGFEVFKVKSMAFPLPNGTRTDVKEVYPSAQSFGRTAWFCMTLERANERFDALKRAIV